MPAGPSSRPRSSRAAPLLSEPERSRAREARRARARSELFDVAVDPAPPYLVLRVANPLRGTRYRVHLPSGRDGPTGVCECPDFGQRGFGTCKHLEAARLWLAEHPGEGGVGRPGRRADPWIAAFWEAVDAARRSGPADREAPRARLWRRPGRLLFDPPRSRGD